MTTDIVDDPIMDEWRDSHPPRHARRWQIAQDDLAPRTHGRCGSTLAARVVTSESAARARTSDCCGSNLSVRGREGRRSLKTPQKPLQKASILTECAPPEGQAGRSIAPPAHVRAICQSFPNDRLCDRSGFPGAALTHYIWKTRATERKAGAYPTKRWPPAREESKNHRWKHRRPDHALKTLGNPGNVG